MQKKLQAVCSQLIEESDLTISDDVADEFGDRAWASVTVTITE